VGRKVAIFPTDRQLLISDRGDYGCSNNFAPKFSQNGGFSTTIFIFIFEKKLQTERLFSDWLKLKGWGRFLPLPRRQWVADFTF